MINLEQIRAALVVTLQQVAGSTSWFPYVIPLNAGVNYPAGWIDYQRNGPDVDYYETFDPTSAVLLDVEIRVRAAPVDAQKAMDRYLSRGTGQTSVTDAIEMDQTLGGSVVSCEVVGGAEVGPIPADDTQDYIARIHLRVMP